jgi:hypothetical protein
MATALVATFPNQTPSSYGSPSHATRYAPWITSPSIQELCIGNLTSTTQVPGLAGAVTTSERPSLGHQTKQSHGDTRASEMQHRTAKQAPNHELDQPPTPHPPSASSQCPWATSRYGGQDLPKPPDLGQLP